MNTLRRGLYRPSISLYNQQIRRVSQGVWDTFGFLKDGTDYAKRASCARWMHEHPIGWRAWWAFSLLGPPLFLFYEHGLIDYVWRRKNIKPLEPDWDSERPFRYDIYINILYRCARI